MPDPTPDLAERIIRSVVFGYTHDGLNDSAEQVRRCLASSPELAQVREALEFGRGECYWQIDLEKFNAAIAALDRIAGKERGP